MWQDWLFLVGGFVFAAFLVPSIRSEAKPAIHTSLWTAAVLTLYVVAFASLGLWLSALGVVASASAWWVLFYQRVRM